MKTAAGTCEGSDHPVRLDQLPSIGGIGFGGRLLVAAVPEFQAGGRVGLGGGERSGGRWWRTARWLARERARMASERLHKAATEGVAGAVLGGGIGAAAGRIAEHTSVSSALRRQLDAIDQSGGFQWIKQRLAEFRAAGRGNEVITADLAPELQNLADFAAQNDSRTYNKAARILNERQPDITERILGDVKDIAGEPLPDAAKMAQQLKDEKYDWANTAYGKLREVQAPVEPEAVQKLISPRPSTT
jgi:hypothetical protein